MRRLACSPSQRCERKSLRLWQVVPVVAAVFMLFSALPAYSATAVVGPPDDPYVVDSTVLLNAATATVLPPVDLASLATLNATTGSVSTVSLGQVDPSLFPRICTYVDVLNSSGVPVSHLPADSFCVKQDGSPVGAFTVQELSSNTCQTGTCLVIDVSGSMANGGKLTAAKNAAIRYVRRMKIYDRTAIVKFSSCWTVVSNFTSDTTALINAINGLTSGGYTAFFDGVWKGVGLTTTELGSKAVIALTDGMENYSKNCGDPSTTPDGLNDGFADDSTMIVNLALGAGIPIYTVTLGTDFDPQYCIKFSNSTGGGYYNAPTGSQLDSIYDGIKTRLCSRYLICFNSSDTVQNGDCHNVMVCHKNGAGTCSPCDTGTYCEKAPPVIVRTPTTISKDNTCQKATLDVQLCAWVTDKDTPCASLTVTLFYRNSSLSPYTSIATTRTDSTFCATVPGSALLCSGDSIQYYFTASDGERTVASPTSAPTGHFAFPICPTNANAGPDKSLTCTASQVNLSGSSSTAGATFSWAAFNGGNIVSGGTTATPLVNATGTYVLTVTDPANGCTKKDTALVTANMTAPNANAGPDKVLTCSTTQLNLAGSSSTPAATFSWAASNGGNIVSGGTTATPLVNAAGTYTLTVTDPANGCTATDVALVTNDLTKPVLSCSGDDLTCDSLLASATVSSTPSTGVTYVWSPEPVSGQGTASARYDAPGSKRVVVTITATGCKDSCDAVITQTSTKPVLTCTGDELTCDSLAASASVSSTPSTGVSYVWSPAPVSGQGTPSARYNSSGAKKVVVTILATGCKDSCTAIITQNIAAPNANAGPDKVLTCAVTQINLSGSSTTPSATYSWVASFGGNIVSGATTATPLVNAAGTYTLTVKDPANGCTATDVALVTLNNTPPNANAGPDKILTCAVTQINLSGSSTTPGATYSWVASLGGHIVSGGTTATPLVDSAGTYTLTVTDPANGCTATDVALVTRNVAPPNANAGPDKVLTCTITQINLAGSSTTPGASFAWVASLGGHIVSGAATAIPLVDSAGTYTLTVTDPANGCTATDVALVTLNNTPPNANAGPDKVLTCAVTQINLSGSSTTPGATYSWVATLGGHIVSGAATATPLVDSAGTYTLTVTDPANGCTATAVAHVTRNIAAPNANAGPDKVLTCTVTQLNLSGSSTTPGATYSWVASLGGHIVSGASTATPLVDSAGTYTLTVTDPANGCTATDVALVTRNIAAPNANAGPDKVLTCTVTQINLSGSSTTPGATYNWVATLGGHIVSGAATATPLVDSAGTYTLTVTDPANGCTATGVAHVTRNIAAPNANAGPDKVLTCTVTQLNLAGSSTTPGATYSWVATLGGHIVSGAATATPLVDSAGTYTLTVTDPANGCTASGVAHVTRNIAAPNANAGPDKVLTCAVTQLNLSGSSTTPGATYSWVATLGGHIVSGAATATPLVDAAGTYTVTVTDPANGCTATDVALVTIDTTKPVLSCTGGQITCDSLEASATVTSVPSTGVSYFWYGSPVSGQGTASARFNSVGSKRVVVTIIATGCKDSCDAVIIGNTNNTHANAGPDKVLTCAVTQVTLDGSSTTPGALYSWVATDGGHIVSGATTATPLVNAAGTYTLTVKNPANGCTVSDVALVTQNIAKPNVSAGLDKVLTCTVTQINLSGSSATVGATFAWAAYAGGHVVSGGATATPLVDASGTYVLTVTDPANGCTAVDTALVTQNIAAPNASAGPDKYLDCATTQVNLSGSSTTPGATFSWVATLGGHIVSGAATATPLVDSAGTYTLTVTNPVNGCTASSVTLVFRDVTPPNANAGPDKVLNCSVTQINLNGSSTTYAPIFSWVASAGGHIVSGANTATPLVDSAGTYTLTVTNPANSCTATDVALVTQNVAPPNASAGPDKVLTCAVTQINLSGSSTTPGATYSWVASLGGHIVSGAATATPLVDSAGTYTLTVTDPANGCTATGVAHVTRNVAAPNANAGPDKLLTCSVTQVTLSGSSTTVGATFSWAATLGGHIVSGATTATPLVDSAGTYTLTATDPANGCTATDVALVTQNIAKPVLSCSGDELTCDSLLASADVSSTPSTGVSYLWTPAPVNGQGTANARYNSPGTKKVVVTILATGCKDSCEAVITQNIAKPVLSCAGDELTCDSTQASATVSSTPSTGVSYLWTPAPVSGQGTASARYDAPGNKKVVVTILASGCKDSCEAVITQNINNTNANAGPDKVLTCAATQLTLDGSSTTPGALYSWVASPGGFIVSGANTATPLINAAGTYTLTVKNPANGCTATDVAVVTQNIAAPNANAGPDEVLTCSVTQLNLSGSSSTVGATFSWAATLGGHIVSGATTATPLVDAPGTYTLTVTDPVNGCTATDVALVTQNIAKPTLSCSGDELTCDSLLASADVASTPSTGVSYMWTPAPVSGQGTANARYNSPGSKKVVVTILATGCKDSCEAVITQNIVKPALSCAGDELTCDSTQASAAVTSNPSTGVSYLWTPAPLSGQGTASARYDTPGNKKVVVTILATGCKDSCEAVITQNINNTNANAGPDKVLTCAVTQLNLSGSSTTPGAIYSWVASLGGFIVSGANTATPLVNAAGTYTLTVKNPANGCTATDVALVTQNIAAPNANAGPDKVLTCAVTQLSLSGSSSTVGATFSWAATLGGHIVSGGTTATPLVDAAGTYTLSVTDPANGCTATDVAVVTQNIAAPNANSGPDKILTCAVTQVTMSGSSTTPGATFNWVATVGGHIVSGGNTATPVVDAAGTYAMYVTDPVNGCVIADTALVTVNRTAPNVNAGPDQLLTCGVTQINLYGSSTTVGATLNWTASNGGHIVSGANTANPLVDAAGTYSLIVTDPANGCVAADTALVTQNIAKPVLSCSGDELTCDSLLATASVTSNPSTGVTYVWSPAPVSGQGTAFARYDAPGAKKVVVTITATGCKDSCSSVITQNINNTNANAGPDKILTCLVTQATLNGSSSTPGALYSWVATLGGHIVTGATTATPLVDAAGTYTLTVKNPANGCTATDVAIVTAISNAPPTISFGPDLNLMQCSQARVCLPYSVSDPDGPNGLVESLVSGPAGTTIDTATNEVCFIPPGPGTYTVIGRITDGCNVSAYDTIHVIIQCRVPPSLRPPVLRFNYLCSGRDTMCVPLVITPGPNDPICSVTASGFPGLISINQTQVCVACDETTFDTLTIIVTSCGGLADTVSTLVSGACSSCRISVSVGGPDPLNPASPKIKTQRATPAGSISALSGQTITMPIKIDGLSVDIGGLDLLLCYDQSALRPTSVVKGAAIAEWEYYTYRYGINGNCTGPCPSGLIHLVALADLDNGPSLHPSPAAYRPVGSITDISFVVTDDRNFIGQCIAINFCSYDCTDNIISSKSGDTAFVEIDGIDPACLSNPKPGFRPVPGVCFSGGTICIVPPPDDRGDLNLDGVANSVADAVLYSRYFIDGISVMSSDPALRAVQILASDINDDGIVLTVADLVYLIRIITGDAQPFPPGGNPKLAPYEQQAEAVVRTDANRVSVTIGSSVDLGAAVLTFRYSGLTIGTPALSTAGSQMVMAVRSDRGELRVLVAPSTNVKGARIAAGINELLSIPTSGEGTIELTDIQMSDAQGALLKTSFRNGVPVEYTLLQNYPNPFNSGTVIQFSLKDQSDWKLSVFNITGQSVRSFSGNGQGQVQVTWDGTDQAGQTLASGVYFYRLETKAFTTTKKMILMK